MHSRKNIVNFRNIIPLSSLHNAHFRSQTSKCIGFLFIRRFSHFIWSLLFEFAKLLTTPRIQFYFYASSMYIFSCFYSFASHLHECFKCANPMAHVAQSRCACIQRFDQNWNDTAAVLMAYAWQTEFIRFVQSFVDAERNNKSSSHRNQWNEHDFVHFLNLDQKKTEIFVNFLSTFNAFSWRNVKTIK